MPEQKIVVKGEVVSESVIEDIKVNRRDILDLIAEELVDAAQKRLAAFDKETEDKMPPEPTPVELSACASSAIGDPEVSYDINYRNKTQMHITVQFAVKLENMPVSWKVRQAWEKEREALREPLQDECNFLTGDKKRLKNELIRRQLSETPEGSRVLGTVEEMRKKLANDLRAKRDALQLEAGKK